MSENEELPLDDLPAEETAAVITRAKDHTFFNERLLPIGWTAERNAVRYTTTDAAGKELVVENPLFDVDEHGNILINYYRIGGGKAEYHAGGAKHGKHYQVKRLRSEMLDKHGDPVKYIIPKGAGTFAWFPPELIAAYREKRQLDVLVLTEGAFKAFCAAGYGLAIVGLTSISHYRDKATGTLHPDVIELMKVCRPKEVVWLVDGDCHDLTRKWPEDDPEADLFKRPNLFYSSAKNIGVLLKDHARTLGFNTWFAHVNSGAVTMPEGKPGPKGLDDLLLAYPTAKAYQEVRSVGPTIRKEGMSDADFSAKQEAEAQQLLADRLAWAESHRTELATAIVTDLCNVSDPPRFFERKELDRPALLKEYFHLRSAQDFYTHYQERIGEREFIYDGTKYKWEEPAGGGQGELKVKVPSVAKSYVRVGTEYFKRIKVPNKFKDLEEKLVPWKKSTIIDDEGKNFCRHIQRLEAFCNVPDHAHWQEIEKSCLNTYSRFEHEPDEHAEPPEATLRFLAHIFGKGKVTAPHPKLKDGPNNTGNPIIMEVKELDLGLDYLQLLYQRPTQMLPILCLVSKQNNTGKSTFFKYLKAILTGNACFIGAKDFESDFNAHYASKKVIIIDEALVEKQIVVEKMKALSTGDKIMVNDKGRAQYEQDFFGCFVMGSNNVRSFIRTTDEETRFWVRDVPVIPPEDLDVELEEKLYREIPAMLHLLNNRQMATSKLFRSWFHPPLLNTIALQEVRAHSQTNVRKSINRYMRDMMVQAQTPQIMMTAEDINREVFKGRSETLFIQEQLAEMGVPKYVNDQGREVPKRYKYPRLVEEKDAFGQLSHALKYLTCQPGRPYVFDHTRYFQEAEWQLMLIDEADGGAATTPTDAAMRANAMTGAQGDDNDLPF